MVVVAIHPKIRARQLRETLKSYARQLDAKRDETEQLAAIALLKRADATVEELEAMVETLRQRLYPSS